MRLIQNNKPGDDHRAALKSVLAGADHLSLAVAFLKDAGARMLIPLLKDRLGKGAAAEAFIGTDFFITEPEALKKLQALREEFPRFDIFLAGRAAATFHPKTYVGRKRGRVRCLIGSANLTGGAMASNDEISIMAEIGSDDALSTDLSATFKAFRADPRFRRLHLVLDQYRSTHEKQAARRRRFEQDLPEPFELEALEDYIRRYRRSPDPEALQDRRDSRAAARRVQNDIAALHKPGPPSKADRALLKEKLCSLMSPKGGRKHHWPSAGIYRHGVKALAHPRETIALFAEGRKSAGLAPRAAYEAMRKRALGIPGIGLNMVTEILCTFDPDRFAVVNGNSAGALKAVGVAAPGSPTLKTLGAQRYAGLCETIAAIGERVDGSDFNDADAFLYWITQNPA